MILQSQELQSQPVCARVLHVVEGNSRGAIENWLLRTLRFAREQQITLDWTFFCSLGEVSEFKAAARAYGADVVCCSVPLGRKASFMRALRSEIRDGKYDVLHCHWDLVSAMFLIAAFGLPLKQRLVHVHNAASAIPTPSLVKQFVFKPLLRTICLALSDRIVGVSHTALRSMIGTRSSENGRHVVSYCGVDHRPFAIHKTQVSRVRRDFQLPDEAAVLLFVGRMVAEKNPLFVLDILASMSPGAGRPLFAVLVGSGPLEHAARKRAEDLGIATYVRITGWREDVAPIMCASDLLLHTGPENPMEGFGLSLLEGQLAGLRLLISCGVPQDVLLPTAVYERLPVKKGPTCWAKAAGRLLSRDTPPIEEVRAAFHRSGLNLEAGLRSLLALYPPYRAI